jgi:predicted TIM-barrel fold metal-dependent hydrolase
MPLESPTIRRNDMKGLEGLAIIDSDVHPSTQHKWPEYLAPRWRDYLALAGRRNMNTFGVSSAQRPYACRLDAVPALGSAPGSDPELAREQLLEEYGLTWGLLNTLDPIASGNAPVQFEVDVARASNDIIFDDWLEADPRWVASISIPQEHPQEAVEEIIRCREKSDRYVQIMFGNRTERPLGNPKYWPIFEVAEHYGLPVASHVGLSKYHYWSGVGQTTYYFETHSSFPLPGQAATASVIFEGVLDRFPKLQVVLSELGWEWAVPYSWRLDATWRVQRAEVAHLQRMPSEYFRDNFWFSTQPAVEPEKPSDIYPLYEQFEEAGFSDHLLFATDYPHWDMDRPIEAIPRALPRETKRKLLAANAGTLYGLPFEDQDAAAS